MSLLYLSLPLILSPPLHTHPLPPPAHHPRASCTTARPCRSFTWCWCRTTDEPYSLPHNDSNRSSLASSRRVDRNPPSRSTMSATKENQRDSGEEDRKLEGGVLRQDPAPPAPKASGLHPAVYIGYVYPPQKFSTHFSRRSSARSMWCCRWRRRSWR